MVDGHLHGHFTTPYAGGALAGVRARAEPSVAAFSVEGEFSRDAKPGRWTCAFRAAWAKGGEFGTSLLY